MDKVYFRNSQRMVEIADEIAGLVMFDPPLWNHVKYSVADGQLGNYGDYQQYLDGLIQVVDECVRVLRDGGVLVTTVPDVLLMRENRVINTISFHSDIADIMRGCGLKLISSVAVLVGDEKKRDYIPADDNLFRMREDFRTTRLTIVQVFCKGEVSDSLQNKVIEDYWDNVIRFGSESTVFGSRWMYRLITKLLNWRWLWKIKQKLFNKKFQDKTRSTRCDYPVRASGELFTWVINRWSGEGDLVVDPFLGTGTTLTVCQKINRRCIGYEINPVARQVILKNSPRPNSVEVIS